MTIPLEHMADNSISDRNFDALARLVPDMGGQSVGVRFGTVTLVFSAGADSAQVTVAHGLGRIPVLAGVFGWWVSGVNAGDAVVRRDTLSAASFDCRGHADFGVWTGSAVASWLVIG